MTCVLSIPTLYTKDGVEIRNKGCESFDLNWITSQNLHSRLYDNQRYATRCQGIANTGSHMSRKTEISNGLSGNVKTGSDMETHCPISSNQCVPYLFDLCNKTDVSPDYIAIKNIGVKRKLETSELEEVYIPHKRVSPLLNTPKERKDERKKIIKISVRKIKQLDNPEFFLRRTVLVNNTMKRLQTELRQEKRRTKKFTSNSRAPFYEYDVTPNDCMSDTYLFDDPFLSGIHEKITDDMTDTLINNVFHDKMDDKSKELDISETSDTRQNEQVVPEEQAYINSMISTPFKDEHSNEIMSGAKNKTVIVCNIMTHLDNRAGAQELSVNSCILKNCEENQKNNHYLQ